MSPPPPPNSPAPGHPEQAEPSIEMEEVVESAPEPPFKEVRGRYRKRRTSPSTPQVQTVRARQTSGATKAPRGEQNSANHHSRRVKVAVNLQRHASQTHRLHEGETLRGWYPGASG
jgi:hypothetical protein